MDRFFSFVIVIYIRRCRLLFYILLYSKEWLLYDPFALEILSRYPEYAMCRFAYSCYFLIWRFWRGYRISQLARHSASYGLNVIRVHRIDNEYRGTRNINFLERKEKKETSHPIIISSESSSKFRCNVRLILLASLSSFRTLPSEQVPLPNP